MRNLVVLLVSAAVASGVLGGCGVTTQDEPQPLVTSTANPAATPTLTQRPDPPSTSPTTTTTGAPTGGPADESATATGAASSTAAAPEVVTPSPRAG